MNEQEYKSKVEETISAYNVKEKEARSGCYWACKALANGGVSVSRYMDEDTRAIAGLKEGLLFTSPHRKCARGLPTFRLVRGIALLGK